VIKGQSAIENPDIALPDAGAFSYHRRPALAAGGRKGRLLTEVVDVAVSFATFEAAGCRERTVRDPTVFHQFRWGIRFLHPASSL
jgi:hypothetical protein